MFDGILASCQRLLNRAAAAITLLVGRQLNLVAFTHTTPEADAALRAYYPLPPDGHEMVSVAAREQIPTVVDDTETDTRVTTVARDAARHRGVPVKQGRRHSGAQ